MSEDRQRPKDDDFDFGLDLYQADQSGSGNSNKDEDPFAEIDDDPFMADMDPSRKKNRQSRISNKLLTPPALAIGGTACALLVFGVVFWLYSGGDDANARYAPLIEAEPGPVRIRASTSHNVPYEDKTVFDRLGDRSKNKEETKASIEQSEYSLPPLFKTSSELQDPSALKKKQANPNTPLPSLSDIPIPAVPAEKAPDQQKARIAALTPSPPRALTPQQAPVKAITGSVQAKGRYRVQLASARRESSINSLWNRLQQRHSEILDGLSHVSERADLGKRGIFYRLQTGPFATLSEANQLCSALKSRGADCLVIKR